jgi:hypothetical protein
MAQNLSGRPAGCIGDWGDRLLSVYSAAKKVLSPDREK